MSNANDMAFPVVLEHTRTPNDSAQLGLTKREYIAAIVLGSALLQYGIATAAAMSVEATDALLAELAK